MEKLVSLRTIIKTIEEQIETEVFISKDGTIFDKEEDCLLHEEKLNFLSYFEKKYKVNKVDPINYGLNLGETIYCDLVFIKKINNKVIDEFIKYYKLEDHPEDLIKLKEGWSFIALRSDVNLWVFNKTDRLFTINTVEEIIKNKKNELNLLINIL